MKKTFNILTVCLTVLSLLTISTFSQAQNKPITAVLYFDVQGIDIKPEAMGNLVRIELEKLGSYEVIDRYDIKYISEQSQIKLDNCFGKTCMLEIGEKLKAEKVISGSVELFGDQIVFTLRMADVKSGRMEKAVVKQYLNLPKELPLMTELSLKELLGLPMEADVMDKLSKKSSYESSLNNPGDIALNLSGPRMGFTIFTGDNATILNKPINSGGYEVTPILSQFGYQFEKQYLNEGKYQALVEFLPMISGIDQGLFIPSVTVMNGLRNNINGFEFAIGPTFAISSRSKGYITDGEWSKITDINKAPINSDIEYRLDSKGDAYINTGLVLAAGKTIRSGKLNIPLNVYAVPGRNGWRFGFSFGFNAKKNRTN
jgi:hypothetical protein